MPYSIETLETRRLLAAVHPTPVEVYEVELINRARANPTAEATRHGIALNEGLAAGTISTAAKQPLAINPFISDAARKHSQWMIDNDLFRHEGPGNNSPGQRITNAGYSFIAPSTWGARISRIARSARACRIRSPQRGNCMPTCSSTPASPDAGIAPT